MYTYVYLSLSLSLSSLTLSVMNRGTVLALIHASRDTGASGVARNSWSLLATANDRPRNINSALGRIRDQDMQRFRV